jgi:hypothetical protein
MSFDVVSYADAIVRWDGLYEPYHVSAERLTDCVFLLADGLF